MIQNLEKINLIKRKSIEDACKFISNFSFIEKMVIFGSSVSNECSEDSDIDVCLYVSDDFNIRSMDFFKCYGGLSEVLRDNCDILIFNKLTEEFKKIVITKGVVVYES